MEPTRRLSLLRKLVSKVADALQNQDMDVTPEMLRESRDLIERCWYEHGSVSQKQLESIVAEVTHRHGGVTRTEMRRRKKQSSTPQPGAALAGNRGGAAAAEDHQRSSTALPPTSQQQHQQLPQLSPSSEVSVDRIAQTTKQQRRVMADSEWNAAFEQDKRMAEQIKESNRKKIDSMRSNLKAGLEKQLEEHARLRELRKSKHLKEVHDMDDVVAAVKHDQEEERRQEKIRAQKQKEFQEAQQEENRRLREMRRAQDRDEQLRQTAIIEMQDKADRERELAKRTEQRSQWQRVLNDNVTRFHDRKRERAEKMIADRETIRLMNEKFDAEERARADVKARKEARRQFFVSLAEKAAAKTQAREQKIIDKVEREAEEEDIRAAEEKAKRIANMKKAAADTKMMLDQQRAARDRQKEQDALEAEALAEAVRQQAEAERERKRQEKLEARQAALKQRQYLDSQLQAQFMREAQPMETSIMRPRNARWDENSSAIRSRLASRQSRLGSEGRRTPAPSSTS